MAEFQHVVNNPQRQSASAVAVKLHFTRTNGAADAAIDSLLELVGGIGPREIVREMVLACLKAGQENDGMGELKIMRSTLKEMRFTAKVFRPYRTTRKVSIFGSARTRPGTRSYDMAQELGKALAEAGYMVITGAGAGIMQAANEGAGCEQSFGINIRLPSEQMANPVVEGSPRCITYKYFFNRKLAFVKEADGVVVLPGGFGTLDEAMEALTLVQTGKRDPLPVLLMDEAGGSYWRKWIGFLEEEVLSQGYVDPSDATLFARVHSAEEAVERINRFYFRYHSQRYVGDLLVLRLQSEIDESRLMDLRNRFSNILTENGGMRLTGALPEEVDEPETRHLPRLVLDFNRRDFAGLRRFIDSLNEA